MCICLLLSALLALLLPPVLPQAGSSESGISYGRDEPDVISIKGSKDAVRYGFPFVFAGKEHYDLVCIRPPGRIRWGVTLVNHPLGLVASRRFVVYGCDAPVIGTWQVGAEGLQTLSFIRENWLVYCRAEKTGKLVWQRSLVTMGTPITITGRELETVVLANPVPYFARGRKPRYVLARYAMPSGRLISRVAATVDGRPLRSASR